MGRAERMNPKSWRTHNGSGIAGTGSETRDRFNRVLQPGDVVIVEGKGSIPWRIAAITPDLHPQAPPGAQRVVLVTDIVTSIPRGVQVEDFIKIQDASELAPLPGQDPSVAEGEEPA